MRLSEKLDAVLGLCDAACAMVPSPEGIAAIESAESAAADFVMDFRDELRQALRDSERYAWMRDELPWTLSSVPHGGYKLTCHMPNVAKLDGIGPDNDDFDAAIDAAMGRREGEVRTFKVCRCHTADARRLCPDKRECMTAEAHATTPEDADDAR